MRGMVTEGRGWSWEEGDGHGMRGMVVGGGGWSQEGRDRRVAWPWAGARTGGSSQGAGGKLGLCVWTCGHRGMIEMGEWDGAGTTRHVDESLAAKFWLVPGRAVGDGPWGGRVDSGVLAWMGALLWRW